MGYQLGGGKHLPPDSGRDSRADKTDEYCDPSFNLACDGRRLMGLVGSTPTAVSIVAHRRVGSTTKTLLANGQQPNAALYQDATALYWGNTSPAAIMRLAK